MERAAADSVSNVHFSPDSRRFLYAESRWKGWWIFEDLQSFVITDGERFGPYLRGLAATRFSADSKHYAFVSMGWKTRKWHVVVDGKEEVLQYDLRWPDVTFSPDWSRAAYYVRVGRLESMVLDGKLLKACEDMPAFLVFSPDSARTAHAEVRGGKQYMVIDGQEEGPYDGISCDAQFSPDSKHVAYVADKGGEEFVVVDGIGGARYEEVAGWTPLFSPDSAHIAYAAKRDGEWLIVVDGVEGKVTLSEVRRGPIFESPTKLKLAGVREPGPEFVRLEVEIEAAP
jgi:hypothetical protein